MYNKTLKFNRHERILEAARTVFGRCGFDDATVDDIAAAASVSKGSIYCHFEDKEDLFYHLVEKMVSDDLTAALSTVSPLSPALQRLDLLLDVLLKRVIATCEGDNLIFEIWASAAKKRSGLRRSLGSAHEGWRSAIKSILDDGRDHGEFNSSIDTEAAASLIMATLSGVIVNWRFGGEDNATRLDKLRHGLLLAICAW